jgi:hypothetical protein
MKSTDQRESWWVYPALSLLALVLGFAATAVIVVITGWNFYTVWLIASGLWVLAFTAKIARGRS